MKSVQEMEKKRRGYGWKRRITGIIACVVVFATTYALVLPAITLDDRRAANEPGLSLNTAAENEEGLSSDLHTEAPVDLETENPIDAEQPEVTELDETPTPEPVNEDERIIDSENLETLPPEPTEEDEPTPAPAQTAEPSEEPEETTAAPEQSEEPTSTAEPEEVKESEVIPVTVKACEGLSDDAVLAFSWYDPEMDGAVKINALQEILNGTELYHAFDLELTEGEITDDELGATITLSPYVPEKGAVLYHFTENNEYEELNYKVDEEAQTVTFATTSFSPFAFGKAIEKTEAVETAEPDRTSEQSTSQETKDIPDTTSAEKAPAAMRNTVVELETGVTGGVKWTLYSDGNMVLEKAEGGNGKTANSQLWDSWTGHATDIKRVTVKSGVNTLGNNLFNRCTTLEYLDCSECDTLQTVNAWAFANSGVRIADFSGCKDLRTFNMQCFIYASNLTSIYFYTGPDSSPDYPGISIGSYVFGSGPKADINFKNTKVRYIGSSSFGNATVTELDFSGCEKLDTIDSGAFSGNKNLESVSFSGCVNLKTIGSGAFRYYSAQRSSLKEVDFSGCESLESIGSYAFSYSQLKAIDLTDCVNLKTIGEGAFYDASTAQTLELSHCDSLETIGVNAFYNCKLVTELTIPKSVADIAENAFNGCTGITTFNWNAEAYPSALGNSTVFNRFSNGYKLTIGNNVNSLPNGFFTACAKCGDIFFDGENELIQLSASAMLNAPVPLRGIDGPCYVDEYGVVYEIVGEGSDAFARVAYCPPGIESYTVPTTITYNKDTDQPVTVPVTAVADSAFVLARDLTSVTYADASQIRSMGVSAFQGLVNLTSVTDSAKSKTETTVSGAMGLFTPTAPVSAFINTGLTDDVPEHVWSNGTASVESITVGTPQDIIITVSKPTQNTNPGSGYTLDNGIYHYLTGAFFTVNVSAQYEGTSEATGRIYLDFSNANYSGLVEPSFVIDNSNITVYVKKTENPDIKYLEFSLSHGETLSFSLGLTYPSPNTAGGELHLWPVIIDGNNSATGATPDPLTSTDQYIAADWRTERLERTVEKSCPQMIVSGDGNGQMLLPTHTWTISMPSTNTVNDVYGKDYCYQTDLEDLLVLPEHVHWSDDVLQAAVEGTGRFIFGVADGNRTITYVIPTTAGESLKAFTLTVPDAYFSTFDVAVTPVLDGSNPVNLKLRWTVKPQTTNVEVPTNPMKWTINLGSLCVDSAVLVGTEGDIVLSIANRVDAAFRYTHSEDAYSSVTAETQATIKDAVLAFQKLSSRDVWTRMGYDVAYTLKVSNTATRPAGGFTAYDELVKYSNASRAYISGRDLERMFEEENGSYLSVTISHASLYEPFSAQATGVDGTIVTLNPTNSGKASPVYSNQTLTITKTGEGQYCITRKNDGSTDVLETWAGTSIQNGLDALGYVVSYYDLYNAKWTFPQYPDFSLYGGGVIELRIYATYKNTFQRSTKDYAGYYYSPNSMDTGAFNYGYLNPNNGSRTLSGSTNNALNRDLTLGKGITRNGEAVDSGFNFQIGDELDYTLSINNQGGKIVDMPMVDDITGAQALLVPVAENDQLAGFGLETYTDRDGNLSYLLTRAGTYRNIKIGMSKSGTLLNADTVTVEPTFNGANQGTGWNTTVKWYFPTFASGRSEKVTYRTVIKSNLARYSFNNTVWLNDKYYTDTNGTLVGDRLFASLFGGGTVVQFEKKIVAENPNFDGTVNNEVLDEDDYSGITSVNNKVTYRITIRTVGGGAITINGKDIFDMLPQTFGAFEWSRNNVEIVFRGSNDSVVFTEMDNWSIIADNPNSTVLFESIPDGQSFIIWPETSSIEFSTAGEAYLYVSLQFTDNWSVYCNAVNGRPLRNTFYLFDRESTVNHDVFDDDRIILQKGVDSIFQIGKTNTREYYSNGYSHIVYYATVYNGGSNRLFLSDLEDTLPPGFRFIAIGTNTSDPYTDGRGCYSFNLNVMYSSTVPVTISDTERTSVVFKKYKMTAETPESGRVTFKVSGDTTNPEYIAFDEKTEHWYLNPGEAIAFTYALEISIDESMTLDAALNTLSMEHYAPYGQGVSVYENATVHPRNNPETPYNDGGCEIHNTVDGKQQLVSDVTVYRGEILPGIKKNLVSYQRPNGSIEPATEIVYPDADLNWEITTYNDSMRSIDGYTLVESMQYPYRFKGKVWYSTYDGNVPCALACNTDGTESKALFEIVSYSFSGSDPTIIIKDTDGTVYTLHLNDENGRSAVIPVYFRLEYHGHNGVRSYANTRASSPYYNPYYQSNALYCVWHGTITVSFSVDPETNKETMTITFPKGVMPQLPECMGKLNLTTVRDNNLYVNTTYVNTAELLPERKTYDDMSVNHGRPIYDESGGNLGILANGFVTVLTGWATKSEKSVYEIGMEDGVVSSVDPDNCVLTLSEKDKPFEYTLSVTNTNEDASMDRLLVIDNLPEVNDHYTLQDDVSRFSEFMVRFAENPNVRVTIKNTDGTTQTLSNGQYTVEYSTATSFIESDWAGQSTDRWTTTFSQDARSIRVILIGQELMPAGCTVNVSFTAVVSGEAEPGDVANNSFAYRYTMQGVTLEASPLLVGVRIPDYPYLVKKVADRFGAAYPVEKDTDFTFLVYKGASELTSGKEYEELVAWLEDNDIDYHEFVLTVQEGASTTGRVKLNNTADWTWIAGETYTIVEKPTRDYTFGRWTNYRTISHSFIYLPERTQTFTAENRSNRWDIVVTKVDEENNELILPGAVFALYGINPIDAMDESAYNTHMFRSLAERTISMPDPADETATITWYLIDFRVTGADGKARWSNLIEEYHYLIELQSPAGYNMPTKGGILVNRSEMSSSESVVYRTITNESGYELPETGGSGSTLYVIGGILLMAAVACVLGLRRRYESRQTES